MKYKFKLITILSAVVLSLNSIVFAASPNNEVIADLYKFKIIADTSDIRSDDNITRAEVIKMLCIAKGNDLWDNTVIDEKIFDDVPVEHWAAKYIQIGVWDDIIHGYGNNKFVPEGYITNQELLKMIVCTLGYNTCCQEAGGYPDGYMFYANVLGFTKDMNIENNAYATRGDTMQMIYNALDAPIMDTNTYAYDKEGNKTPEFRLNDDGSYLSYRMILDGTVEW